MLLEVAAEAIVDAGLPLERLRGSDAGVFVGISANNYGRPQNQAEQLNASYLGAGGAGESSPVSF